MKTTFIAIAAAIIALIAFFIWKPASPSKTSSQSSPDQRTTPDTSKNDPAKASPEAQAPTSSSRKREITKVIRTGTWHPTKKGHLVSPYNNESLPAIGVISGAKMTDSDGQTFTVPAFEDSPFPINPIPAPFPGRKGFFMNPWTGSAIDARGIPPGTRIRDPADPDPTHILELAPKVEEDDKEE